MLLPRLSLRSGSDGFSSSFFVCSHPQEAFTFVTEPSVQSEEFRLRIKELTVLLQVKSIRTNLSSDRDTVNEESS